MFWACSGKTGDIRSSVRFTTPDSTAAWQPTPRFPFCLECSAGRCQFPYKVSCFREYYPQRHICLQDLGFKVTYGNADQHLHCICVSFTESAVRSRHCSSERLWAHSATNTCWCAGRGRGFGQNCQSGQNQWAPGQYTCLHVSEVEVVSVLTTDVNWDNNNRNNTWYLMYKLWYIRYVNSVFEQRQVSPFFKIIIELLLCSAKITTWAACSCSFRNMWVALIIFI